MKPESLFHEISNVFVFPPPVAFALLSGRTTQAASLVFTSVLVVAAAATATLSHASGSAPYLLAAKPITDAQGRIEVISDFTNDAHLKFPGDLPTLPQANTTAKSSDFFHTAKALALVANFETRYKFRRTGMTSWVGNSATGYLSSDTIETLRADPLVKQVSQNQEVVSSAATPPPWQESALSTDEYDSWGRAAVKGRTANVNTGRKIYIIDGGVAPHDDLPPMTRLNVACGSSGNCNANDPYTYPLTGCYAHATHVAGIIGAIAGNGKTTQGAYAAFPNMVSLNTDTRNSAAYNCTFGGGSDATQGYALDYIAYDATQNNPNRLVHIVNMSKNSPQGGGVTYQSGTAGPNWSKVKNMTTTIWAYGIPISPGVFFVQSAGNRQDVASNDACLTAYRPGYQQPAAIDDGVMVVGGVDSAGKATSVNNPFLGSNPANIHSAGNYSTHGACVDIWAPGNNIVSTWGQISQIGYPAAGSPPYTVDGRTLYGYPFPYGGNVNDPYEGWAYLSGTSIAAPFVAAVAAWLADNDASITTPSALETAVRNNAFQWSGTFINYQGQSVSGPYTDGAGLPVRVVQLPERSAIPVPPPFAAVVNAGATVLLLLDDALTREKQ